MKPSKPPGSRFVTGRIVPLLVVGIVTASGAEVEPQIDSAARSESSVRQESKVTVTDWTKVPPTQAREAAEQGDVSAQFHLGWAYSSGAGVPRNDAEAATFYRKAAEQGHAMAQNNLGHLFQEGRGVPRDLAEALKWYRQSAGQGEPYGQSNLGWMYHSGLGVEKDREQAEYWFRKAADQGFAYAEFMMGELAGRQGLKGDTVVGNYQVASEWYAKAAAQGHARAMFELGDLHYYGKLGHNHREAARWFYKAAGHGEMEATMRLGDLYSRDREDLPADHVEAARWYLVAAEQGNVKAQYRLGSLLSEGDETVRDLPAAGRWLREAAHGGSAEAVVKLAALNKAPPESVLETVSREELEAASFNADGETRLILARAYEEGLGGPVDMHRAAEMYWRILNLGPEKDRDEALRRAINLHADGRVAFRESSVYSPKNPDEFARLVQAYSRRITSTESLWQVGDMFERGYQLPESKGRAVEWLTRAATAGSAHAMNRIGELWAAGLDGASDSTEAIRWFEKAAKRGLGKAQLNLGLAYQRGEGVTSDAIEAAAWLRLAADQNLSEARRALTGLESAMTTEQIESAGRRSRELAASIRADRPNQ